MKPHHAKSLAIPGQSNAAPVTASTRATDAASVSYSVGADNTRTISFNGLAAQGTYQSAVDSVNNFFGTAPATKAPGPRGECRYGDKCTKQGKGCKYQHPVSKQAPKQRQQAPKQNDDVIDKLLAKNEQLRAEIQEKDDTISSHEQTIRDLFAEIESLQKQLQSGSIGSWADATNDQGVNQNTDQADDQAARIAAALSS